MPNSPVTPSPTAQQPRPGKPALRALRRFHSGARCLTTGLGRLVSWVTLAMVLLTCLVVALRYGFDSGTMALQELVIYLHCTLFLLALAYTADVDQQVRVDIFYRRMNPVQKAWVNCLGSLVFLLPFAIYLLWVTWPWFIQAWTIREASPEAGGLPWVYWLKGLLPLAALALLLQALGQVLGNLARLLEPDHA